MYCLLNCVLMHCRLSMAALYAKLALWTITARCFQAACKCSHCKDALEVLCLHIIVMAVNIAQHWGSAFASTIDHLPEACHAHAVRQIESR